MILSHPGILRVRRSVAAATALQLAAGLMTFIRRLRTGIADVAASGQFGPVAERESGRRTGARV